MARAVWRKFPIEQDGAIIIPANALVVLCGPAACGKSTFARGNFAPTQIVSSDRCRALVCDDEGNMAVSGHAFDLFYFIVDKRLRLGRLTVADSTALARQVRKQLLSLARGHSRPAHLVAFELPIEELIERDRLRDRTVGEDVVRRQADKFRRTLENLCDEGFDQVWRTGETATVTLAPPA